MVFASHRDVVDAVLTRPLPQDVPQPGMLTINIDLKDAPKGIYRVYETIPVKPGFHLVLS